MPSGPLATTITIERHLRQQSASALVVVLLNEAEATR
jgi:hypothetical protein